MNKRKKEKKSEREREKKPCAARALFTSLSENWSLVLSKKSLSGSLVKVEVEMFRSWCIMVGPLCYVSIIITFRTKHTVLPISVQKTSAPVNLSDEFLVRIYNFYLKKYLHG